MADKRSNRFDQIVEDVTDEWAGTDYSKIKWKFLEDMPKTDSHPFKVIEENGSLICVAKPGKEKTVHQPIHRAANEKIISDLAYHLGIPVPPVTLWKRDDISNPPEHYCCVSAWAFKEIKSWNEIKGGLTEDHRNQIALFLGQMETLAEWASIEDRGEGGKHVIFREIRDPAEPIQMAFIDHAFSLSKVWSGEGNENRIGGHYLPEKEIPPSPDEIQKTLDAIQNKLDEKTIRGVVENIPQEFWSLPPGAQPRNDPGIIISNLLNRRIKLKYILSP